MRAAEAMIVKPGGFFGLVLPTWAVLSDEYDEACGLCLFQDLGFARTEGRGGHIMVVETVFLLV